MSERRPNNAPGIIFGGLCGLVILGLFGAGFYSGAKSVSDEMKITIPEPPDLDEQTVVRNKIIINVEANNSISLEDVSFEDVASVKSELIARGESNFDDTLVILRLSEDASHNTLVSMKDMLDELGAQSMIEVVRHRGK